MGVDWLNRQLGGTPYDDGTHTINWCVDTTVLLGAKVGAERPVNVADDWRQLAFLQEWACDGVVLSNDTPSCFEANGQRDGQLFNIAVQGVCPVNNGYGARRET